MSFGCRTNQEEMAALEAQYALSGHTVVDDPALADVLIVNTCSVTEHTEAKIRRTVQATARRYPHLSIVLTGCMAQRQPREIRRLPGVSHVIGNRHKQEIPSIIERLSEGIVHTELDGAHKLSLPALESIAGPAQARRTRFAVKIQEGCAYQCAYCIVPQVRGGSRSADISGIVDISKRAIDAGYKEIVLTGTHIGQFRDGNGPAARGLAECVAALASIDGDFRIRLSSLDPRDLSAELADLVTGHPRLCRHVHVSVQSLCDEVLGAMRRSEVTASAILDRLARLRSVYPAIGIGCDIIVGFPGETDGLFRQTLDAVQTAEFSYGHVFRFSRRPGTPAATMTDQVSEAVKTRRAQQIRDGLAESRRRFLRKLIGSRQRIIIEHEENAAGLTSNYVRATVPGRQARQNEWLAVVPVAAEGNALQCVVEENPEA
jgi:threonylcarbamoyladenosine tRNA methylthiotransferase MtaB